MTTNTVQIQAIRHATMLITVGGKRILVDPMLSPKAAMPPTPLTRNRVRIPLVDLPVGLEELKDVDAILLTHLHFDHFDKVAEEILPRNILVFCQPTDVKKLKSLGFAKATPIHDVHEWSGLTFHRTTAHHGTGIVRLLMGKSSGYMIGYGDKQTVYIGGDAIYDDLFEQNLDRFKPQTVILFAGHAQLIFGSAITMTSKDVAKVCNHAPNAQVVVVHMEALNHCGLTRNQLRKDLQDKNLLEQVSVPRDGEVVTV